MYIHLVHMHFGPISGPTKMIRVAHFVQNVLVSIPVKNELLGISVKMFMKHPTLLQNIGMDSKAKLDVSGTPLLISEKVDFLPRP